MEERKSMDKETFKKGEREQACVIRCPPVRSNICNKGRAENREITA